jgi:hypothetical protein
MCLKHTVPGNKKGFLSYSNKGQITMYLSKVTLIHLNIQAVL